MIRNIQLLDTEILSQQKYVLKKVTYRYTKPDGSEQTQVREAYDRGNGAALLLYDRSRGTVILTRQFRLPTFLNGNASGMLTEVCAGLLDGDDPETCVKRESEEETGYRIESVQKVMEAYMSPGAVTEIIHFFIGAYSGDMKVAAGGGLEAEGENIEVLEMPFEEALRGVANGAVKDAKTIMLLQYLRLHGIL